MKSADPSATSTGYSIGVQQSRLPGMPLGKYCMWANPEIPPCPWTLLMTVEGISSQTCCALVSPRLTKCPPSAWCAYCVYVASQCHSLSPVSYTHLRAHETDSYLVCRLLLE